MCHINEFWMIGDDGRIVTDSYSLLYYFFEIPPCTEFCTYDFDPNGI